jgi:hypothetical protein
MVNRKLVTLIFAGIISCLITASAQTNIGYLGKKVALGYSPQVSLVNFVKGFDVLTHTFNAEFSTQRYQSLSISLGYKKTKVPTDAFESQNDYLSERYLLNGQSYSVDFQKMGGDAHFRTLMFGLKVNFFYHGRTFAAPNGFCQYIKADYIKVTPTKNNYEYELLNPSQYTAAQIANAKVPEIKNAEATLFNVGFGLASKKMVTRSLFLSFNAEVNVNTLMFLYIMDEDYTYAENINEDLFVTGKSINKFKQFLGFGFGVGVML